MTAYFEYLGKKSSDFNMRLYNNFEFISAEDDIEFVEIMGLNGDLAIDNERLEPIEKSIYFDVMVDESNPVVDGGDGSKIHKKAIDIINWLQGKGYNKLRFSMYPGYYYLAMFYKTNRVADTTRAFGRGVLNVKIKPIMYFDNQLTKAVTSKTVLVNNGTIISKPKITLQVATDTATIQKNGADWIRLKDLGSGGTFIIDSEFQQATHNGERATQKMIKTDELYPKLDIGSNQITFDSTQITSFEIEERYGMRAL